MDIKISVIVPVYNCQNYLNRCIDSLLDQTMDGIEIILVDDGSTDESLTICEKYKQISSNIVVLSQSNKGVSAARNFGYARSSGQFISYVDADDWVEPSMYEKMYNRIVEEDAQACMCNYFIWNGESKIPVINDLCFEVYDGKMIKEMIVPRIISSSTICGKNDTISGSMWNMLFKRSLTEKYMISFNERMVHGEDALYKMMLMEVIDKLVIELEPLYYYFVHESSAVSVFKKDKYQELMTGNKIIEEFFGEKNMYDIYRERLDISYAKVHFSSMRNIARRENKMSYFNKVKEIRNVCMDERLQSIIKEQKNTCKTINSRLLTSLILRKSAFILFAYYILTNYLLLIKGRFNG